MHEDIANLETSLTAIALHLRHHQTNLVAAESCTGGLLAATITEHAGCSDYFAGSFVTYQVDAKISMLDIPADQLRRFPPVSEEIARAMATAALARSNAEISIAITGLAGPEGDGTNVEVGTLWIAWGFKQPENCYAQCFELKHNRREFRQKACALALQGLARRLLPSS